MIDPSHTAQTAPRDHGGGLDAAIAEYGGQRAGWIDLSTGINPDPYPVSGLETADWAALPDRTAQQALTDAARSFWAIPDEAGVLAAPGASALISILPTLIPNGRVQITMPTYNEHAASFVAQGWRVVSDGPAEARVIVHPNNPDGRLWKAKDANAPFTVIDESFCDVTPKASLVSLAAQPGVVVLKSFGKFWGLAGLRLGFAIARPDTIARLNDLIGPWAVSGPALRIGAAALQDQAWATATRKRLTNDCARMDAIVLPKGAEYVGGCDLFRLYRVKNAHEWQVRLAKAHIWTRIFPYSDTLIRLGIPPSEGWARLEAAL